jgi:CheY-like chemotaxis protein
MSAEGRAMSEPARVILLVEDEAMLRMAATDLLEDMGFRVETAASAREATARVDHAGADYDAVIIDLGLPDRSGAELAREIRDSRADVPIVIASGYDEAVLDEALAGDARVGFLGKPYGVRSMTRVFVDLGIAIAHPLVD